MNLPICSHTVAVIEDGSAVAHHRCPEPGAWLDGEADHGVAIARWLCDRHGREALLEMGVFGLPVTS